MILVNSNLFFHSFCGLIHSLGALGPMGEGRAGIFMPKLSKLYSYLLVFLEDFIYLFQLFFGRFK